MSKPIEMPVSTLRPGLLVSLRTSCVGNISYTKRVLEQDRITKEGSRHAKWETERDIQDAKEFAEATQVRLAARVKVKSVCAISSFGLLCPEDKEEELKLAVQEARAMTAEFNRKAKVTQVEVYIFCGRVASDDVEAVRTINSEVRDLLQEMEEGLKNLDVKTVRRAANDARSIGKMLTPDAEKRIKDAIDAARGVARKIVKAGENVAVEIDKTTVDTMKKARTAFLDMDSFEQIAKPTVSARAVDLLPEVRDELTKADAARGKTYKPRQKARALDM